MDYLSLFMLALHVVCAVTLIGGAVAWRFATIPGIRLLESGTRAKVDNAIAAAWRPVVIASVAGLLITGVYNLMHRAVQTKQFHILFGIKMLLALHVFAVSYLATRPDNARRSRQLTGVVISGAAILIISAAFRWV
jgi:hypothetical protein